MIGKPWGFSLIEVLVGLGILSGSGIFMMKLAQEQSGNLARAEYQTEAEAIMTKVLLHVNEPKSCTQIFAGQLIGPELTAGLNLTVGADTTNILRLGDYPKFRVNSIRLEPHPIFPASGMNLRVEFSPIGSGRISSFFSSQRANFVKTVSIVASLNGSLVRSCGPVVSDSDVNAKMNLCNGLGAAATWDNTNQRCVSRLIYPTPQTCAAGWVPSQISNLGTIICVQILNVANLRLLFGVPGDNAQANGILCPSRRLVLGTRNSGSVGHIFLRCFNSTGFNADNPTPNPYAEY